MRREHGRPGTTPVADGPSGQALLDERQHALQASGGRTCLDPQLLVDVDEAVLEEVVAAQLARSDDVGAPAPAFLLGTVSTSLDVGSRDRFPSTMDITSDRQPRATPPELSDPVATVDP